MCLDDHGGNLNFDLDSLQLEIRANVMKECQKNRSTVDIHSKGYLMSMVVSEPVYIEGSEDI